MVQYIHTPWRDRAELFKVRQQFYPAPPSANNNTTTITGTGSSSAPASAAATKLFSEDQEDDRGGGRENGRREAVSRVAMWVQRGSCPHMVESTGLLMAAILEDLDEARTAASGRGGGGSTSAVRLAYSAAFARFVTGLLDSHQDKQMKQSMYSIAKTIGLPATFVELRHQCTHEQLPSLLKLRSAAQKSLAWIWDYYWKHLTGDEPAAYGGGIGDIGSIKSGDVTSGSTCAEVLSNYLLTDSPTKKKGLEKRFRQWDEVVLLETLTELGESAEDPRVLLRSLQLSQEILDGRLDRSRSCLSEEVNMSITEDLEAIQAELIQASTELDTLQPAGPRAQETPVQATSQGKGWARYEGTWKPKPIGIV